jgi:hypothetical protein
MQAIIGGLRFGRSLPPPSGRNVTEPEPAGHLAAYFDDHTEGPGLWKWRHYFPIYERHLQRFIGQEVNLVEVGIYSGGSLDMWLDYLGPRAHIYGIDIEGACRAYESERIDIFIGDQGDPQFWRSFLEQVPRIDIVIDDGGHSAHHQIATLKAVLPVISPGGLYICEDSHGGAHAFHAFIDSFGHNLHVLSPEGRPTSFQSHVASIHRYPYVTVIEKPPLPVPRFESQKHGTQWEPFPSHAK